ncbi:ABC transporter ATP-binding protein [Shimazuella alba]|uniref:Iron complex transport system ATP-binding protein n=1 Tax=Shimazuella alba TaxID=2690964 RepID=A0A6I4W1L0_9BACL|nr:ABC transporter ATP-binding protein [Shimazuella alba]MXQ55846.1 hypothetical protein [Shimazuella alba]
MGKVPLFCCWMNQLPIWISSVLEIIELVQHLNDRFRIIVILVLYDLNHTCLYYDQVIVMKEGFIFQKGTPKQVMTKNTMQEIFGVDAKIGTDLETDRPYIRSLK